MGRSLRTASLLRASCALAVSAIAGRAMATPQYSLVDMGTFGGPQSHAYDINNNGQIAGDSDTAAGPNHAFQATGALGPGNDVGVLPTGTQSFGYAINSTGAMVGSGDVQIGVAYLQRATKYSGSTMYNLGILNQSQSAGLDSWARAINKNGVVVGYSQYDTYLVSPSHAFIWTPKQNNGTTGTMTDIGTFGGLSSYAWSINDNGQVVGAASYLGDLEYHAFRYSNGSKTDLGTLGGAYSEAYDINLGGDIVGASTDASGATHAFIYSGGVMMNLDDLISPLAGWNLHTARAINDSGQIVGYGYDALGELHVFLLSKAVSDCNWNVDASGSWSLSSNWSGGSIASGTSKAANFGSVITADRTITVSQAYTVAQINFNSTHAYTISGASTITIDNVVGAGTISVASGSHAITSPIALNVPTLVSIAGGSTLTVSGSISSTSSGLDKRGDGLLLLSGNNTYTGPTKVSGGTLAVSASGNLGAASNGIVLQGGTLRTDAAITSTRNIALAASGGTFDSNTRDSSFGVLSGGADFTKAGAGKLKLAGISTNNLTVAGGTLQLRSRAENGGLKSVARINGNLSLAPGTALDLNDNDLVVSASDSNAAFTQLTALVDGGYSMNVDPTKTGIVSTTSQTSGGAAILALFNNSMVGATEWPPGSGQSISGSAIVGKYTYFGDMNLDGQVTGDDYAAIDSNLDTTPPVGLGWLRGDANLDGIVSGDDYAVIDSNLGHGMSLQLAEQGTSVPEPAVGSLIAVAMGIGIARHRRRR